MRGRGSRGTRLGQNALSRIPARYSGPAGGSPSRPDRVRILRGAAKAPGARVPPGRPRHWKFRLGGHRQMVRCSARPSVRRRGGAGTSRRQPGGRGSDRGDAGSGSSWVEVIHATTGFGGTAERSGNRPRACGPWDFRKSPLARMVRPHSRSPRNGIVVGKRRAPAESRRRRWPEQKTCRPTRPRN